MLITCKTDCCGCGACAATCRHITMTLDEEGFPYPVVNDQCIHCGGCLDVCPMPTAIAKTNARPPQPTVQDVPAADSPMSLPTVYAAWNQKPEIRKQSTSGGIFTLLAEQVINQGGLVFGVVFDEKFNVRHVAARSMEELGPMRGAKYIPSDTGNTFIQVKNFLAGGKPVLYTGTPCQIAGLKKFLGNDSPLLLTCDLACHGVPSELVFRQYLDDLEQRYQSKVSRIAFRDKVTGWNSYSVHITFANGDEYSVIVHHDPFMQLFLRDLCLRPVCHVCPFKMPRRGDITLADYWGFATAHPGMDDNQGTSLILINSEKGRQAFAQLVNQPGCAITVIDSSFAKAVTSNPAIIRSAQANPRRPQFMRDLQQLSFEKLCARYLVPPAPPALWCRIVGKLKRLLRPVANRFYRR